MKLYATVTSERASKGQGGEYLDIKVQDKNKYLIARFAGGSDIDGEATLTMSCANKRVAESIKKCAEEILEKYNKGEKQKGEGVPKIDKDFDKLLHPYNRKYKD